MELEQLQEQWRLLEQNLNHSMARQDDLLRRLLLQGTRRQVGRHAWWPTIDLLFGIAVVLVCRSFLANHWRTMTLAVPGLLLMLAGICFVIDNIRQLVDASQVAWDGSITKIQLALGRLRRARIRQFKWIILLSPLLWWCTVMVGSEMLFGVNVVEKFDFHWVVANILIAVLWIPGGILVARYWPRRFRQGPGWASFLDQISGRSLTAAEADLKCWAELHEEPANRADRPTSAAAK